MFGEAGHNLLHRARSLRRLRPADTSCHQRQISTASSSGSDSSKRDHSVEWDPLRLHPSMDVERGPLPTSFDDFKRQQHQQQQQQQQTSGVTPTHRAVPPRQRPCRRHYGTSLEIHDGFDFGFDKAPSPTPSLSSSVSSVASSDSFVDRRLRPSKSTTHLAASPQQQLQQHDLSWSVPSSPIRRPPPVGHDRPDFYIKRGEWKRRGIVFGSQNNAAQDSDDDDVFEV